MSASRSYAGIGSRQTPPSVLLTMRAVATTLAERDWVLRSGHAQGADLAFERGADIGRGAKQIWLPGEATPDAMRLSAQHHPAWERCGQFARDAHARNAHIVLGQSLDDPVRFVICWTPGASASGGTGQAIRIAKSVGIPVFDLADPSIESRVDSWLEGSA